MRDRCAWISKKVENETGFAKERGQIKVKQIESYGIKIKSLKLKKYCIIQRSLKCCYRTPNQTPNMPNQCVKASYKDWAPIETRFTPYHLRQRAGVLWTPDYCPNALCQYLLCSPLFFLETGVERKHQWTHSEIFTKITTIEQRHPEGTELHNGSTQPSTQQNT